MDACSRRSILSQIGAGFGSLAFQALCQTEGKGAEPGSEGMVFDPINPYLPRKSHFIPRAKSVIFLYMVGGPSQVDTFDYKPLLQKLDGQPVPQSIRNAVESSRYSNVFKNCRDLMASPYKFSQQGESGMWVSELFPNVAKHVDDLCFIHSMQAESNNHAPSSYQMHTGRTIVGKPSLGSWVTYGLGTENQNLPGYVLLFENGPYGGAGNYSNGFLPAAFQGTRLRSEGTPVLDLLPPPAFAANERDTLDLIRTLNLKHRDEHTKLTELDARIASYELAYRMQSAALEVGDVEKEPAYLRASYGLEHSDKEVGKFGRKCLLARRLVERGVRFVQVYNMIDGVGWDAHDGLPKNHPRMARQCDQPIAALLEDLKERGLLDETLVIWASEFGRTPMMQGRDSGRQHNAAGFTIWMAGGGVKPGRIGATDEIGLTAVEKPYAFKDLHATILAALGLDNEELAVPYEGREERLTGINGNAKVIPRVFAV
ncbi:DUF1501 domain-containing protein [soil metagenome]